MLRSPRDGDSVARLDLRSRTLIGITARSVRQHAAQGRASGKCPGRSYVRADRG